MSAQGGHVVRTYLEKSFDRVELINGQMITTANKVGFNETSEARGSLGAYTGIKQKKRQ